MAYAMGILGILVTVGGSVEGQTDAFSCFSTVGILGILVAASGLVEGQTDASSCFSCPNDFTLADGSCFSVSQQVPSL